MNYGSLTSDRRRHLLRQLFNEAPHLLALQQEIIETALAACQRIKLLTGREKQVLAGVSLGLQHKEIARALGMSPRTVEIHRANIIHKMQLRSSKDVARAGIYAGYDLLYKTLFERELGSLPEEGLGHVA